MTNESKVKVDLGYNTKESSEDRRITKDDFKLERVTPTKPPGILKSVPQGGSSRTSVVVETPSSRSSEKTPKPEQIKQTGVNKTMSDTAVIGSKSDQGKGDTQQKQSTSTPTSSTLSQTNTKSPLEVSKSIAEHKAKDKVTFKDATATFREANSNQDLNKLGGPYIPPIQSHGGPTQSNKSDTPGVELSSSSEIVKSYPAPGMR